MTAAGDAGMWLFLWPGVLTSGRVTSLGGSSAPNTAANAPDAATAISFASRLSAGRRRAGMRVRLACPLLRPCLPFPGAGGGFGRRAGMVFLLPAKAP
jgi:hypothetical protein